MNGSVPWVPASMRQVRAALGLIGYTVGIKNPSGKFHVNFVLGFFVNNTIMKQCRMGGKQVVLEQAYGNHGP